MRLKLKYGKLLSKIAFNFNLRHYDLEGHGCEGKRGCGAGMDR